MAVEMRTISSGDEGVDEAHRQLVELATAIDASCEAGDYDGVSDEHMARLLEIVNFVFELEQAAMDDLSYLKAANHIEEHEILIATVALIKDSVGVMLFSIAGHIETMDVPLADQISKKIRKPAVATRRSSEPAFRPPPSGRMGAPLLSSSKGDDAAANLKTIIVNTYAAALMDLKISRGLTGDRAKTVAYEVTARAVNKTTGKKISGDFVKQIIISQ